MPWPPPCRRSRCRAVAAALELVQEVRRDARAEGRERVPDRDGAAVHVERVLREPELLAHASTCGAKASLISTARSPRAGSGSSRGRRGCRHGADAIRLGIEPAMPQPSSRRWREALLLGPRAGGHDDRARAVADTAREPVDDASFLNALGSCEAPPTVVSGAGCRLANGMIAAALARQLMGAARP